MAFAVVLDATDRVGEQPASEITMRKRTIAEAILGTWATMAKLQSHGDGKINPLRVRWQGALWCSIQAIEH